MNTKPRAYLDMDGPLADYDGYCIAAGIPHDTAKNQRHTYALLPVTPGAADGVALLELLGFEVWILTKLPRANPYAATEKLQWVARHFPALAERVIMSPDKGAIGTRRDILIDDRPHKANCRGFRGRLVVWTEWPDACNANRRNLGRWLEEGGGSFGLTDKMRGRSSYEGRDEALPAA